MMYEIKISPSQIPATYNWDGSLSTLAIILMLHFPEVVLDFQIELGEHVIEIETEPDLSSLLATVRNKRNSKIVFESNCFVAAMERVKFIHRLVLN